MILVPQWQPTSWSTDDRKKIRDFIDRMDPSLQNQEAIINGLKSVFHIVYWWSFLRNKILWRIPAEYPVYIEGIRKEFNLSNETVTSLLFLSANLVYFIGTGDALNAWRWVEDSDRDKTWEIIDSSKRIAYQTAAILAMDHALEGEVDRFHIPASHNITSRFRFIFGKVLKYYGSRDLFHENTHKALSVRLNKIIPHMIFLIIFARVVQNKHWMYSYLDKSFKSYIDYVKNIQTVLQNLQYQCDFKDNPCIDPYILFIVDEFTSHYACIR
jgi:hypothetical protein